MREHGGVRHHHGAEEAERRKENGNRRAADLRRDGDGDEVQRVGEQQRTPAIQQVVSRPHQPAHVEERFRLSPLRRGLEAREVGRDLPIARHEVAHLLLRHVAQPASLRIGKPDGEIAPPRQAPRDDRVLLARRAGVAARRDTLSAGRLLALVQRDELGHRRGPFGWEVLREPGDELVGQHAPPLRLERAAPSEEAVEQLVLLFRERGGQRRHGGLVRPGRTGARGRRLRHALVDDEGAGEDVADALPRARDGGAHQRHAVGGERLSVHHAGQVAHRRRGERHRVPAVLHHPDANAPLSGRLAIPQRLEQHEVPPEQRELHEDGEREQPVPAGQPGAAECGGHVTEPHPERDAEQQQNRVIDQRGRSARADAGNRVREHHLLGRLDFHPLLESTGNRAGLRHAISLAALSGKWTGVCPRARTPHNIGRSSDSRNGGPRRILLVAHCLPLVGRPGRPSWWGDSGAVFPGLHLRDATIAR